MSGSENLPNVDIVEKPLGPSAAADSALLDLVSELRGELNNLKGEVLELRSQLATPEQALLSATTEVPAEGTLVDASAFTAELELALASPDPNPEEMDDLLEVDEPRDEAEIALETAEALKQHPELSEVIGAIEDQLDRAELDPDATSTSTADDGLSSEEMDALYSATSQLGSTPVVDEASVEAVPEPPNPSPAATSPTSGPAPAGGTLLSEDEIMKLLEEAKGDPRVIPVDPKPELIIDPVTGDIEAELISADEIKAMLGVKDEVDDSLPEAVPPVEEAVVSEEIEVSAEPEFEASESIEPSEELDMETIDPSAVSKVPAGLAAAALALPVCVVGERLHCLCIEPFDTDALSEISKAIGLEVVPHAGAPARVLAEIRTRYGVTDEKSARQTDPEVPPGIVARVIGKVLRRTA